MMHNNLTIFWWYNVAARHCTSKQELLNVYFNLQSVLSKKHVQLFWIIIAWD